MDLVVCFSGQCGVESFDFFWVLGFEDGLSCGQVDGGIGCLQCQGVECGLDYMVQMVVDFDFFDFLLVSGVGFFVGEWVGEVEGFIIFFCNKDGFVGFVEIKVIGGECFEGWGNCWIVGCF